MGKKQKPQVIAIVGAQWGDEGKGKIVDYFSSDADVVIRAQGGDNAGHSVANPLGKFALHLIPAGIFNPKTINIIGAGVALNPVTLIKEIKDLESRGISCHKLFISPKAHLTFDYHLLLDGLQEKARGDHQIGTTKRGIGPTYMDKAERIGLSARLLADKDRLFKELGNVLEKKKNSFSSGKIPQEFNLKYYTDIINEAFELLAPKVTDTHKIITTNLYNNANFVIEGAHGALLDLDHGTYPRVTSSNSTVGGLLTGAEMPPLRLTRVVGVFKAYQTRVGEGGMPTELKNDQGDLIRERGHEYGTTTGRPRRVGFFDGVAAKYASEINGFTDIALTRVDTLGDVGDVQICKEYELNGESLEDFPVDDEILTKCQAVYKKEDHFEGWNGNLSSTKAFGDLPKSAQKYCLAVAKTIPGARLSFIGVGEKREDLIVL